MERCRGCPTCPGRLDLRKLTVALKALLHMEKPFKVIREQWNVLVVKVFLAVLVEDAKMVRNNKLRNFGSQ
jgi:hypothetical protein